MRGTLIIFLLLFSFTHFCQAQNGVEIDERLKGLYHPTHLKNLKESKPQLLERLNYYLDHAYIIIDQKSEKPIEILGEVIIDNLDELNILQLEKDQQLKRSWDKISVYKIKGSDQLLVFHSGRNFTRDFQTHYRKIRQ